MDNLNTHYSESAVCLVAEHIGSEGDLGRKGRCGILRNAASRQAFLSDPEHPLGFHFTPKHASWLNQIEIWFSSSSVAATSNPRATWPAGSAVLSTTSTKPWPNHSVGHIKTRPPPFDHERYHYFRSAVLVSAEKGRNRTVNDECQQPLVSFIRNPSVSSTDPIIILYPLRLSPQLGDVLN